MTASPGTGDDGGTVDDRRAVAGRVALVTGASRGLGAAIADRLARVGVRVGVSARTLDPDPRYQGSLRQTVESISAAGGVAVPFPANLAQPEERRRLVGAVTERLGPVDILVNNAAVTYLGPIGELPEKRWRLMFEVQVRAPYELAELVLPAMRERRRGWILNVSSRSAVHPMGPPYDDLHVEGGFGVYGMCKAALDRFTTGLAAEVHADGVAVNSLAPWDNVPTPGAGALDLVEGAALEGPDWMAEAALALCSGPAQLTGRIAYSQPLLAELGLRPAAPGTAPPVMR